MCVSAYKMSGPFLECFIPLLMQSTTSRRVLEKRRKKVSETNAVAPSQVVERAETVPFFSLSEPSVGCRPHPSTVLVARARGVLLVKAFLTKGKSPSEGGGKKKGTLKRKKRVEEKKKSEQNVHEKQKKAQKTRCVGNSVNPATGREGKVEKPSRSCCVLRVIASAQAWRWASGAARLGPARTLPRRSAAPRAGARSRGSTF